MLSSDVLVFDSPNYGCGTQGAGHKGEKEEEGKKSDAVRHSGRVAATLLGIAVTLAMTVLRHNA